MDVNVNDTYRAPLVSACLGAVNGSIVDDTDTFVQIDSEFQTTGFVAIKCN